MYIKYLPDAAFDGRIISVLFVWVKSASSFGAEEKDCINDMNYRALIY